MLALDSSNAVLYPRSINVYQWNITSILRVTYCVSLAARYTKTTSALRGGGRRCTIQPDLCFDMDVLSCLYVLSIDITVIMICRAEQLI